MWRWVLGLLAALAAGGAAYTAGARASKLTAQADQERRVADSVGRRTRNGRAAVAKAKKLDSAAKEANKRAEAGVQKLAKAEPTVEELVDKWRRGS